jgi:hypothetical protein
MADKKMTAREFYNAVIGGKITDKEIEYAREAILKLDNKNAKRKAPNGEIKEDNKPIAEAILSALANGSMTSPDLAKAIGQNTQKTNGVAGEMVKLGMLDKTKVKVKGKGELTSYSLTPTEEVATEEVAEEVEGE